MVSPSSFSPTTAATAPSTPQPGLEALQWDVFCRVVDNFGDIGVCWRLATQLAQAGQRVRLWVDDASALAWMAPGGCPGVELRAWNGPLPAPHEAAPQVLLEAFGCDIPPAFLAYSVAQAAQAARPPVWINLEYLSAESYVERNHRLPSLLMDGPAKGWTRWFFYPGFTPATGGLLREADLQQRQAQFNAQAWRARLPTPPGLAPRWMSLFCYEPPALPALLAQLTPSTPSAPSAQADAPATHLLVTPGRATEAVRSLLQASEETISSQNGLMSKQINASLLSISFLNPCPQTAFDEMLWACDLNCVRGEDSLVRALWAGRALVWHIYPQHDNAHHDKLQAFLDWLQAPASLRQFHATWNGVDDQPLQVPDAATLAEWTACVQAARTRLLAQDSLINQLLGFVREKR